MGDKLKIYRQRAADLKAEILAKKKERAGIGEAALARESGKRDLTDDERAKFLALGPEVEKLEGQFAENAELLAAAEAYNEYERNYQITTTDPDVEAAKAAAKAAGITPEKKIEVVDMTKKLGYFGSQLQAIRKIALSAKGLGESVTAADMDLIKPMLAAPTGLNTDVGSEGGYLVQQERSNTILQRAYQTGAVLSRVTRMPIGPGANGMTIPAIDETSRADSSRYGGIVSTWVGQGTSVTSGKPKFRIMDMKLRKCMATVYATDEQLNDAIALEGWINRYLPLELTFRTEDAVFNGTGSNQPLGVLSSGAVIQVTRNTSSRVLYDDVKAMWLRMWAPARTNSAWFVDQSIEGELETMSITIGTGGQLAPVYKPAGSTPGQVFATLYGRPVLPVEYCAALGTSGDIILADLSEYTVIDKGGVEQAVSIHVAFLTDEQVFRFIYRVDGQLNWNSALTPKSGGNTLSCAVKLS